MIKNYMAELGKRHLIDSGEVHIWLASLLENEKDIAFYKSVLSEEEVIKASSYKFFEDQKSYIISRGILRYLLAMYLKQNPQDIKILYGPWGKPHLLAALSLQFNMSHSRDYVIYSLSPIYEVGIDLEYIDPYLDINAMTSSILSSSEELEYWQGVKEEEKIQSFFELWVCKEAYLKASGKGWLDKKHNIPIQAMERLKGGKKINSSIHKMNPYIFEATPGYAAALFIKGADGVFPMHYAWNLSNVSENYNW